MTTSKSGLIALILAGTLGAGISYGLVRTASTEGTDNAYVRADITPVSTRVAGLVAVVAVGDNQEVEAGDVLYRLDDRDYKARVAEAKAAVTARVSALESLNRSLNLQRTAIDSSAALLVGADAEAARARRELSRIQALQVNGWVTRARTDEAIAAAGKATAEVDAASANVAGSNQQLRVLESQRQRLRADLAAAEAALQLARIDLESTTIRAPTSGRVAERQARSGQYVRPGTPLIALVGKHVWVVANFRETELKGLKLGDRVIVAVDAVPGRRFLGIVESFSPASGAQFALFPPENATGNFTRIAQRIPVRIRLLAGQKLSSELRPGMSAKVRRV